MTDTITIPVQATYRIVNGEAVQIAAEYAEISADAVARFLMDAFHISTNRRNEN